MLSFHRISLILVADCFVEREVTDDTKRHPGAAQADRDLATFRNWFTLLYPDRLAYRTA